MSRAARDTPRTGSRRVRACGLLVALSIGASAGAQSGPPKPAGDPRDPGVVTRHAEPGVRAMPWSFATGDFEDPAGLEVHLSPTDDPDTELVYPCGSWFQPPPGSYLFWIEGPWRMSAYSGLFGAGDGQTISLSVGDAGRVVLPAREVETASGDLVLELLQAATPHLGKFVQREIVRRRPVRELGEGLLMPEGKAVAALWDRKKRRFVALSRPFEVKS